MHSNPERLAWNILMAAFAVFLVLCGIAAYLAQWLVFQSTVDLDINLTVARGTVSVLQPATGEPIAVSDRKSDLEAGVIIQTDPQTQATLTFVDPRTNVPVASMIIFRDSQVHLISAVAPRFGLNRRPYQVQVESGSGRMEFLLLDTGTHSTHLEAISTQMFARMQEEGRYIIDITPRDSHIAAETGEALVVERRTGNNVILVQGEQATLSDDSNAPYVEPAQQSVLVNPDFRESYNVGWKFYNDREPPGEAYNAVFDGRPVIVIDRSQGHWPDTRLDHAETGLVQALNVNVSTVASLELRATFYVDEQSLSTCGVAGSECPMTLHIKYIDPTGAEQTYIHGFYAAHDPSLGYPTTCLSCRAEHDRISSSTWYTFESGNLLSLFPSEQHPVRITEISFYSSGHAYKIYVSEINLFVAK